MSPPAAVPPDVLVVDDDDAIRWVVQVALEDEGFVVATARDGAEALIRVEEEAPTMVLLDLNMPVMDGWTFLIQLRTTGCDLPVIVMTAGLRACAEAEQLHAAGCLPKPFELDQLVAVVARCVRPAT
jgi:two-component system, OmpR family, response regulator MprA